MRGYELKIKLEDCKHEISRTIIVPETLTFTALASDLRIIFDLTFLKPSLFKFPGINTPLWDENDHIIIKDFLDLFKRFKWVYYSKNLTFNVKVKKTSKAENHSTVASYEGEYNPLDYRSAYEFDMILYEIEDGERGLEDITRFDIDEANRKLR